MHNSELLLMVQQGVLEQEEVSLRQQWVWEWRRHILAYPVQLCGQHESTSCSSFASSFVWIS